ELVDADNRLGEDTQASFYVYLKEMQALFLQPPSPVSSPPPANITQQSASPSQQNQGDPGNRVSSSPPPVIPNSTPTVNLTQQQKQSQQTQSKSHGNVQSAHTPLAQSSASAGMTSSSSSVGFGTPISSAATYTSASLGNPMLSAP